MSLGPNADLSQYYDNPNALSKTFKYTTMSTQAALLGRNGYGKRGNNANKVLVEGLMVDNQSLFN